MEVMRIMMSASSKDTFEPVFHKLEWWFNHDVYDAYDHHDLVACIWNSSWNLTLGILASGEGQNPFVKDNVIYHMDWHTRLNSSHIWITHKTMGHQRAWWVSYFTFHFANQKLFFYYLHWEMLSPLVGCTSNLNMYSSGTLLFSSYFSYN
jgi:hypothetical protein